MSTFINLIYELTHFSSVRSNRISRIHKQFIGQRRECEKNCQAKSRNVKSEEKKEKRTLVLLEIIRFFFFFAVRFVSCHWRHDIVWMSLGIRDTIIAVFTQFLSFAIIYFHIKIVDLICYSVMVLSSFVRHKHYELYGREYEHNSVFVVEFLFLLHIYRLRTHWALMVSNWNHGTSVFTK